MTQSLANISLWNHFIGMRYAIVHLRWTLGGARCISGGLLVEPGASQVDFRWSSLRKFVTVAPSHSVTFRRHALWFLSLNCSFLFCHKIVFLPSTANSNAIAHSPVIPLTLSRPPLFRGSTISRQIFAHHPNLLTHPPIWCTNPYICTHLQSSHFNQPSTHLHNWNVTFYFLM